MHRYVHISADIFTLDTSDEITAAREAMREDGIASLPIFEGGPDLPEVATGETLEADGTTCAALATEHDVAGALQVLLDPEGDEAEREEVLVRLGVQPGDDLRAPAERVSIRSFQAACLLTDNAGLVLQIGDREFQITVVRSR